MYNNSDYCIKLDVYIYLFNKKNNLIIYIFSKFHKYLLMILSMILYFVYIILISFICIIFCTKILIIKKINYIVYSKQIEIFWVLWIVLIADKRDDDNSEKNAIS